ncbi:MAG: response regulator [Pyrinomonadaceae bacterium]
MRLEFEPGVTTLPVTDSAAYDDLNGSNGFDLESLLKKGVAAAQSGERDTARKLLSQASAIDPACEDAWMWLASISEYPEELLAFLDRVLSINPNNERAIEWRVATRSLLAKTFVQRAEVAYHDGSLDLAGKCTDHAIDYDENIDGAWFMRALLTDNEDEQLEYLEKVLELNPEHEKARNAVESIFQGRSQAAFNEAKEAAVAGDHVRSVEILDAFLVDVPDSVEAWILRSHLSQGLDDKVGALEKALEIDPDNAAARSGLSYLNLTFGLAGEVPEVVAGGPADNDPSASQTLETAPEYVADDADQVDATPNADAGEDMLPVYVAVEETENQLEPDAKEPLHIEGAEQHFDPYEEKEFIDEEKYVDKTPESPLMMAIEGSEDVSNAPTAEFQQPSGLDQPEKAGDVSASPFESKVEESPTGIPCPFCGVSNDQQEFECGSCLSTLTLSDLEGLFANHRADREVVQGAVAQMEADLETREFNESDFVVLGLGHFNLGHAEAGLKYLQAAARVDPNNVILSGQVNAIAIRLDELRRQNELHPAKAVGKTILVVDDSPTVRKLISGKLEKSGHVVVCASDGVEALERLETELPDLVLLDITMPRMDGYEVCKQIRANPDAKDLPVVMISGKDGFFDKVRGRMAGTTGYVTKPFGPETLMKALETYLIP